MELDRLPVQVQTLLRRLAQVVGSREPAIRAGIQALRAKHPHLTSDQLAMELIRSTRRRVAATGAVSGAASIAPGLGTVLAIGTVTSQALYALEQEVELVLAIAMVYGHELGGSEDRVLEALVVIGIASGALKLREDVSGDAGTHPRPQRWPAAHSRRHASRDLGRGKDRRARHSARDRRRRGRRLRLACRQWAGAGRDALLRSGRTGREASSTCSGRFLARRTPQLTRSGRSRTASASCRFAI